MSQASKTPPFLGTGWTFPPVFDRAQGVVKMVSGTPDVAESLFLLLSTAPGERPMNPAFGCNMRAFVFEEVDQNLLTNIETEVRNASENFEPRVLDVVVQAAEDDTTPGVLTLSIQYTVRSTNSRYNMVYPYCLREATSPSLTAYAP